MKNRGRSSRSQRTTLQKAKIFYARTYRHLKSDYKKILAYYLLFLTPCLVLFLFTYTKLTSVLARWTLNALSPLVYKTSMDIWQGEFLPFFGGVYFVSLPDKMPSSVFLLYNLVFTLVLLLLCKYLKGISRPIAVYLTMGLVIHLVSCLFFIFFRSYFPYTLTDYSELYMKQQVGIWFSFIAIAGVVSGVITEAGVSKYIMVAAVALYSFVFGCLRYVVFLAFLSQASSLFMAVLLFVFGPFFDFLYLVSIYSVYINNLIIRFDDRTKGVDWQWS